MRPSPELQRENARDLVCAWALATEELLATCDPDKLSDMFETAKERASEWTDEQKAANTRAATDGSLTARIFSAKFIARYRRKLAGAF